jgi:flavin reductase (DIM6/NTAB) family NADH-FMN oxidoreductase RutF
MRPVALPHASRLLNHGPTVLVSSRHGEHRNLMAAAWSMPVEFTPPRIAVVIDKSTWTRRLVEASGAFALNLPGPALADLTWTVGSESGRALAEAHTDKFARHAIATDTGPALGLPLVVGCLAWLECRVLPLAESEQAYDTFFAEVVSAQADERVFRDGRWQDEALAADPALRTLHHLGAGRFAVASPPLQARLLSTG